MQNTKNYGFNKPENTDFYKVSDFNENMDIIDEKLKEIEDNASDLSEDVLESKTKLAGIEEGAQKNVEPTKTTTDSTLSNSKASTAKINAIRGNSEQKSYSGKNLLKNTATSQTINGITFTVNDDGSVTCNGTATALTDLYLTSSTTYDNVVILTGCPSGGTDATYNLRASGYGADYGSGLGISGGTNTAIYIRIASGVTVSNLVFKPMIRLASITDSTYEPYVGGIASPNPKYPQAVNSSGDSGSLMIKGHGRNVFDIEGWLTSLGYTYTKSDNVITLMASGNPNPYFLTILSNAYKVADKDVEMTVSIKSIEGLVSGNNPSIYIYNASGNMVGSVDSSKKSVTVVGNRLSVTYASMSASGSGIKFDSVQVEIGDTATSYEPYTESTFEIPLSEPLHKVNDYFNYLEKGNYHKKFVKKVYDGATNKFTAMSGATANKMFVDNAVTDAITPDGSEVGNILCSHMGAGSFGNIFAKDLIGACYYDKTSSLRYGFGLSSELTTLELANAWLAEQYDAGTPFTVIYQLAEEVFEPFADEYQSLFYQLETYDNVTYITTDSTVQPEIEVEYAVTDAGALMLNNYAKSNLAELTAEKAQSTADKAKAVADEALIEMQTLSDIVDTVQDAVAEVNVLATNAWQFVNESRVTGFANTSSTDASYEVLISYLNAYESHNSGNKKRVDITGAIQLSVADTLDGKLQLCAEEILSIDKSLLGGILSGTASTAYGEMGLFSVSVDENMSKTYLTMKLLDTLSRGNHTFYLNASTTDAW